MPQLYIAYGSNMNCGQMAQRCPTAVYLGPGRITGWKLMFRRHNKTAVANVELEEDGEVLAVCWNLEKSDEEALDGYEGVKYSLYRKVYIPVMMNGSEQKGLIYIMNVGSEIGMPAAEYFERIKEGYISAGFDVKMLQQAYDRCNDPLTI